MVTDPTEAKKGSGPPAKGPYDPDRIRERTAAAYPMTDPTEALDRQDGAARELSRIRGMHAGIRTDLNSPIRCAAGDPKWPCDTRIALGFLDAAAARSGAEIGQLRAALEDVIDRSNPMHSGFCASQDDEAPCICGTGEVMDRAYELLGKGLAVRLHPSEPHQEETRLPQALREVFGDRIPGATDEDWQSLADDVTVRVSGPETQKEPPPTG